MVKEPLFIDDSEELSATSADSTILIIDDNVVSRKLLKLELEKSGYQTLMASSGEEGIKLAIAEKPVAVMVDLVMPENKIYSLQYEISSQMKHQILFQNGNE